MPKYVLFFNDYLHIPKKHFSIPFISFFFSVLVNHIINYVFSYNEHIRKLSFF